MKRIFLLLLVLAVVMLAAARERPLQAADPAVDLGLWANYGIGTPNFPTGFQITATAVNREGILLIGTNGGGIATFDGTLWKRFTTANGLADNTVNNITPQNSTFWIATNNGASLFSPLDNSFTNFTPPNKFVRAVVPAPPPNTSTVLMGTPTGLYTCGLLFPNGLFCSVFTTANSDLAGDFIYDIALAANGDTWVVSNGGVNRYKGSSWSTFTSQNTPGCPDINGATDIAIDDENGRVWLGMQPVGIDPVPGNGACLLETGSGTWSNFHPENSGLGDDTVYDVTVDNEGRAWFATAPFKTFNPGGAYVCTWINDQCFWQSYNTADGMASQKLLAASSGFERIWLGTSDTGLSSFAPRWQRFPAEVQALAALPGQILAGTPNDLRRFNGTSWTTLLPGVNVKGLLALSENAVWAASSGSGIWFWNGTSWTQFNTANSPIASNNNQALVQDALGRIWIAHPDAGISVYDPAGNAWAGFDAGSVLPSNDVRGLAVDGAGGIWAATANGLAHYDGTSWETLTSADGLPANNLNGVAVSTLGHIWVSSTGAAGQWDGSSWTIYNSSSSDLPDAALRTLYADANGSVWLATNAGAAVFDGSEWMVYNAVNSGLLNERLNAFVTDADGDTWFGSTTSSSGVTVPGALFVRGAGELPAGVPAPQISSFLPTKAKAGETVTLTGTNFGPGTRVYFKGKGLNQWQQAITFNVSHTSAEALVPPQAIQGSLRVVVDGVSAVSSSDFNPLPVIISINPSSAVVGEPVEILGTNLDGPLFDEVKFGSGEWDKLAVTEQAYNRVLAHVSADASSGELRLRTVSGEALSPEPFTLVDGGLVVFGWEVQQGIAEYPLVAGKSTIVRLFVGTDAPGHCAYANSGGLDVFGFNNAFLFRAVAATGNRGVPNDGLFCNTEQIYTSDGSIDFYVPGEFIGTKTSFAARLSARFSTLWQEELGSYDFTKTDDWRIHGSVPTLPGTEAQMDLLQKQLTTVSRVFPVRDGWGEMGSQNGVQVTLSPYTPCNGVKSGMCAGGGLKWDFWQDRPTGQLRALTTKIDNSDAADDGQKFTRIIPSFPVNSSRTRSLIVRIRPQAALPAGSNQFTTVATLDSASQPGTPDATRSLVTNFNNSLAASENAVEPGPVAPNAPNLFFQSATTNLLVDVDASGNISPGDVVELFFRYNNSGDATAENVNLTIDYDEQYVTVLKNGGLMLAVGDTFATELIPGQFWMPRGWTPNMHDAPFDLNYNGVIDPGDLSVFVPEFDNWNPVTGDLQVSTISSQINPGEVIRSWRDSNGNGKYDDPEELSIYGSPERTQNQNISFYEIPWSLTRAYNEANEPDADFSALWYLDGVNPFMGPGQASGKGSWANADSTSALAQELGHNLGQVKADSPNTNTNTNSSHDKNDRLAVPIAYDTYGHLAYTGDQTRSIMNAAHPIDISFFAVFEYFEMFEQLRLRALAQTSRDSDFQAGPIFVISGQITTANELSITDSYISTETEPDTDAAQNHYTIHFLSGSQELSDYALSVDFNEFDLDDHHHILTTDSSSFSGAYPFPAGTTAVQFRHEDETIGSLEVSPNAPTVTLMTPNGGENINADGSLNISWQANDVDGDDLHFALRYSPDNGVTWQTVAAAAQGTSFTISAAGLPGSDQALIEITVNDGFHTAVDRSNATFKVGPKPPLWAAITSPPNDALLVQNQPIPFNGSAYDLEDGYLTVDRLTWNSDQDGDLGSGQTISPTLTVGTHLLTLTGTDSDGGTAAGHISVEVQADFDGDGLSDAYEQSQGVLDWWNPVDAGEDSDDDGLSNRGEAQWGTKPDKADSDGDGIADGAEVSGGSSPNDPDSRPLPLEVIAGSTKMTFLVANDAGKSAAQNLWLISSRPQNIAWTAETNTPWLSVTPTTGMTPGAVTIKLKPGQLPSEAAQGEVVIKSNGRSLKIPIILEFQDDGEGSSPIFMPVIIR